MSERKNYMPDLSFPHEEHSVGGKKLLYFNDKKAHPNSCSGMPSFNLCLCDENYNEVWNMRDVCGEFDKCCVGFYIDGENEFYFTTFTGMNYLIDARTLRVIERKFVK